MSDTAPRRPLDAGVVLVVEPLRRPVPGGIGTYTRGLIRGIAALGAGERPSLRLYASRPPRRRDPLAELGVPLVTSALSSTVLVRSWDAGLARVGRGAGVVHAVSLMAPPAAAPLVVAVHDIAFRTLSAGHSRRGRLWHEHALRRVARHAAVVVVPSTATATAIGEAGLGIGEDRLCVVEYGSDHLAPADDEATDGVLHRIGVEGEYLLAVGTIEPRKNLERLFSAFALARRRLGGTPPLVVVGPLGWGREGTAGPSGVVFAGAVAEPVLSSLYHRALAVCYVPLLEGFGLPVVEAMRAGAPVLSSPVPSAGGASYEVDPLDVEAIAEGIVTLSSDEECRRRLVAAGAERAGALTWEATARGHVAAWTRAAS